MVLVADCLINHMAEVIVAVIIGGYVVALTGFWYSWRRMEHKIDKLGEVLEMIITKSYDHVDWETFNHHKHDDQGRMVHGD
jgi:hypothetical protein